MRTVPDVCGSTRRCDGGAGRRGRDNSGKTSTWGLIWDPLGSSEGGGRVTCLHRCIHLVEESGAEVMAGRGAAPRLPRAGSTLLSSSDFSQREGEPGKFLDKLGGGVGGSS